LVLKNVKEKKFLNTITEVIRPLIPIIVIAGLLISISNIFEIILGKNFFEDNKNSF
jgi:phosphotransferase system  glucose/maltose/N-acetylglucosamine-specific IIC component